MTKEESYKKLVLGGGTVVGIAIFLAITFLVQFITLQHPKRWDVTRVGKYTLAPQSTKVLDKYKKMNIPIEVLAFFGPQDKAVAGDLLDQYRDMNSDLQYKLIDPDKQRALAVQNKVEAYPTLVIKAGDKVERITTIDEETFTNALVKLLREEIKKVYVLKGHGEPATDDKNPTGFDQAKAQIEKQNYKVEDVLLLRAPSVPDDAAMLIVAGPKTDPMEGELESIRKYLKRGGKLMVLLTPFETPKLASFLKEYGFVTADDIVVDRMSRVLGGDYLMPVITSYVKFPITKNFNVASIMPMSRSVRVSRELRPHIESKELAFTSPVSWTINEEQLKSGNANFDEKTGTKGPIPVMAVSTYTNVAAPNKKLDAVKGPDMKPAKKTTRPNDTSKEFDHEPNLEPNKARIVVFGSSQFASNRFFKIQGNSDLFMNTVSWLAEEEDLIAIRPKSEKAGPLVLTSRESTMIFVVVLMVVPIAWIIAGIFVYTLRKRTALV